LLHGQQQQQQQQRKCSRQHDISNDCSKLEEAIAEPGQSGSSQDEAITEPGRARQLFNIKRLRHGVSAVLQRSCDMQKRKPSCCQMSQRSSSLMLYEQAALPPGCLPLPRRTDITSAPAA
jgi:hypothetical protein